MSSNSATARTGRVVLEPGDMGRALKRMAHEILERNKGLADVVLVGIHKRGFPLAQRLAQEMGRVEGSEPQVGSLDVSFYRDDHALRVPRDISTTQLPFDVQAKTVVLVDDVLFTGRTIRAAIDALVDLGRPRLVQLAVLIDRGHRELPIRADFIGKNIPTAQTDDVEVRLASTDGEDVILVRDGAPGQ